MQYFIGSEDGLPDFLLEYPEEEIVLPFNIEMTDEGAETLGRVLEIRDLGRPVVSMYPGGTTVVLNARDVRQLLVLPKQEEEGAAPEPEEPAEERLPEDESALPLGPPMPIP